jgi:hypothetical protein
MAAGEAVVQTRLFLWTHYRNIGGLLYTYVNQYELFMAQNAEVMALAREESVMTAPIIAAFLGAGTEERLRLAKDSAHAATLTELLGQPAYDEYRELATRLDTAHLAFGAPKNLLFVPGVVGSFLQSPTHGGIWWIDVRTRDRIDHLNLSADGTQDADPANDIIPTTTDYSCDPFLTAVLGNPTSVMRFSLMTGANRCVTARTRCAIRYCDCTRRMAARQCI